MRLIRSILRAASASLLAALRHFYGGWFLGPARCIDKPRARDVTTFAWAKCVKRPQHAGKMDYG